MQTTKEENVIKDSIDKKSYHLKKALSIFCIIASGLVSRSYTRSRV